MTTKITILQRGGYKNHTELERAARFFLADLLSARMANTLSIRIEVRSSKLEAGTAAKVAIPTNGSKATKSMTITLDRDRPLDDQIADLAHELVHVAQAVTGRLQYRRWKTDDLVHARWEGAELGPVRCINYADRPWEVEAHREERRLAAAYRRAR